MGFSRWAIAAAIAALCGCAGVDDPGEVTRTIDTGKFEITVDEDGREHIRMLGSGYGVIQSPGDPALPERIVEFRIPLQADWDSVGLDVKILKSEVLEGTFDIAPNPPMWMADREHWGEGKSIVNGRNVRVYGRDGDYPEEPVQILSHAKKKGAKVVRVAYRPFLYNPVSGSLTFIRKVRMGVKYRGTAMVSHPPTPSYDYVIITTNDIVDNSEKLRFFINLKKLTHDVLVVTEDDYGGLTGPPPNQMPEKIRKWLIDNEPGYGIDTVLLIGDPDPDDPYDPGDHVGDVPMKWCMPDYFGFRYREVPTDTYYADLDGNWDLDGDGNFGEMLDVGHPETPDPINVNSDYFSVRWEGTIHCDFNHVYKFHTFSDGGVRLYIDGNLVIDNWDTYTEHPPENDYHETPTSMSIGDHAIILEYKEHTGDGIIKLFWQTTADQGHPNYLGHEIIPLDHLKDETGTADGLTGRYYNNITLSGTPALVKADGEVINFVWGTGDLGPAGPNTVADVDVSRIPVYNDDYEALDRILEKIIQYECDPGSLAWRESALLAMAPLASNTPAYHYGEELKDHVLPGGWSYYRLYEDDYSGSGGPTPEDWPVSVDKFANEWKNGYGVVTWWTHGSSTGASYIMNVDHVPGLDNGRPSFVFMSTCSNATTETTNNLAFEVLHHGGVSTFGATRPSIGSRGDWTYDSTSSANPNFGYKTIDHLINDGFPAATALYEAKDNVAQMTRNGMIYNVYGDPDTYFLNTIPNQPPVADVGGPYTADEGSPCSFDGSGSSDPDGFPYPLEYRWDFDNDGTWDTAWSSSPHATFTWNDDFSGFVTLEVSDGVLTDIDGVSVTVSNTAPVGVIGGPYSGDEASPILFSGSASDAGSDDLTFTWEFEHGPTMTTTYFNDGLEADPDPSPYSGLFPFAAADTVSHAYGDNGTYVVTLTVEDDDGGVATYTTTVTVDNLPPTGALDAYILLDFDLRVTGRKWAKVELFIIEEGSIIAQTEVTREPGDPEVQAEALQDVKCHLGNTVARAVYTPAEKPDKKKPFGANPCELTLTFAGVTLRHTFNAQHPNTWEWETRLNPYFVGKEITFEGDGTDPGSDDLTFDWDWGDSTPQETETYYNDDTAPDPLPSPWGVFPFDAHDERGHTYTAEGNYTTTLTITDDDGGVATYTKLLILS